MLAMLLCRDAQCRAAFEASGSPAAIEELRCEDCGGRLKAVGWADGEPDDRAPSGRAAMHRAA